MFFMCLAVPCKVLEKKGEKAIVDYNGVRKEVNISFVDCEVGDYVLIHVGFAIEKVDKDKAEYTLRLKERFDGENSGKD